MFNQNFTDTYACFFSLMALQPGSGHDFLLWAFYNLIRNMVGLFWMSDQLIAKASTNTGQHNI
jgi:hypothetical protein